MKQLVLLILFAFSITNSYSQTKTDTTWVVKAVGHNQWQLFQAPFKSKRNALLSSSAALVTVGTVFLFDSSIRKELKTFTQNQPSVLEGFKTITHAGGYESIIGITAGSYLYGLIAKNNKWQQTGQLLGVSLVGTSVFTLGSKWIFARERPYVDGRNYWHFFDINEERSSFISGHSSASFTIASIFSLQFNEQKWVKWVAYGSATLISVSRMVIDQHWSSDVIAGAALGYAVGHLTYKAFHNTHLTVLPKWTKNAKGLSLSFRF